MEDRECDPEPALPAEVDIAPTIEPEQLRAVALCCGPYAPQLADGESPNASFLTAILWSFPGTRGWRHRPLASTMNVIGRLTRRPPPAFVTVGNADPLAEHSRQLVEALGTQGVAVEMLLYPQDHEPPLAHEYQFDLDLADARTAFERIVEFPRPVSRPAAFGYVTFSFAQESWRHTPEQ